MVTVNPMEPTLPPRPAESPFILEKHYKNGAARAAPRSLLAGTCIPVYICAQLCTAAQTNLQPDMSPFMRVFVSMCVHACTQQCVRAFSRARGDVTKARRKSNSPRRRCTDWRERMRVCLCVSGEKSST